MARHIPVRFSCDRCGDTKDEYREYQGWESGYGLSHAVIAGYPPEGWTYNAKTHVDLCEKCSKDD